MAVTSVSWLLLSDAVNESWEHNDSYCNLQWCSVKVVPIMFVKIHMYACMYECDCISDTECQRNSTNYDAKQTRNIQTSTTLCCDSKASRIFGVNVKTHPTWFTIKHMAFVCINLFNVEYLFGIVFCIRNKRITKPLHACRNYLWSEESSKEKWKKKITTTISKEQSGLYDNLYLCIWICYALLNRMYALYGIQNNAEMCKPGWLTQNVHMYLRKFCGVSASYPYASVPCQFIVCDLFWLWLNLFVVAANKMRCLKGNNTHPHFSRYLINF